MYKVGLTGNYFSGLDEIAAIFAKLNIPIFEADLILRFFFYNNSETIKKIQKQFGKTVFVDNQLDLNKFNDSDSFRKLLNVVELDLLKAYEKWRLKQSASYTIFKSSIIFEAGWNENMNFNISVFKPTGLRTDEIQRIFKMKSSDVYNMLDSEMDVFQKNRLSNYVIHNYNNYGDSVKNQVNTISKTLNHKCSSTILSA